jgi:hypothetical protein
MAGGSGGVTLGTGVALRTGVAEGGELPSQHDVGPVVEVTVGLLVNVGVAEGVVVRVAVADAVADGVTVCVAVADAVADGVTVCVAVDVDVGVQMTRPLIPGGTHVGVGLVVTVTVIVGTIVGVALGVEERPTVTVGP